METVRIFQQGREEIARDGKVGAAEPRLLDLGLAGQVEDPDIAGCNLDLLTLGLRHQSAGVVDLYEVVIDGAAGDRL